MAVQRKRAAGDASRARARAPPGVPLGPEPAGRLRPARRRRRRDRARAGTAAPGTPARRGRRARPRPGADARGATAVVTLEPCNHTGRTGPCAAGADRGRRRARRVRAADPNPVAAGRRGHAARRGRRRRRPGCWPTRREALTGAWTFAVRARPPVRHLEVGHHPRRAQRRRRRHQPVDHRPTPPGADVHGLRAQCDAIAGRHRHRARRRPAAHRRATRAASRCPRPPAAARRGGRPRRCPPAPACSTTAAETLRLQHARPARGARRAAPREIRHASSSRAARRWRPRSSRPASSTRWSPTSRPALLGAGRAALGDLGITTIGDALRLRIADVTAVGTDVGDERRDSTMTPQGGPLMFTGIVEELGTVAAVEQTRATRPA